MSNIEILRCPFCGGEASVNSFTSNADYVGYVVKCRNCSSTGRIGSCEANAIKAWNRRSVESEKKVSWLFSVLRGPVANVVKSDNALEKLKKIGFHYVGNLTHGVGNLSAFEEKSRLNKSQLEAIKEKLCEIFPKQSYPETFVKDAACWGWWWL